MAIDLEAIYQQTKKEGLISPEDSSKKKVNLDEIWNQTKKVGLIEPKQAEGQVMPSTPISRVKESLSRIPVALMQGIQALPNQAGSDLPYTPGLGFANEFKRGMFDLKPLQGNRGIEDFAKDYFTDPRAYQGAIGGAMVGLGNKPNLPIERPGFMRPVGTGAGLVGTAKSPIALGGEKAMKKVAIKTADDMLAVDRSFADEYSKIITEKPVPTTLKDRLKATLEEAKKKTSPESTSEGYLDDLDGIFSGEDLNMKQLHNLKGELYKRMRSAPGTAKNAISNVYDEVNAVLGDKALGGKAYQNVNQNFRTFSKKAEAYLEKLIYDTQKNITGKRLASETIRKQGLSLEQKKAFQVLARFAGRKDISPEIQAMLRGERFSEVLRKLIPVSGAASMGYLGYRLVKPFTEN